MANSMPAPVHIIQDSRYAKQDAWELDDISLCSSGNIAVSGNRLHQSYVCIYGSNVDNSVSGDRPKLFYQKQFTDTDYRPSWQPRCISFIKPNSTEIVTCQDDEIQVIDYNQDVVLRSRKVNGRTTCLSASEGQIFIRLAGLDIVNIYDNDLNRIQSIRLKGIRGNYGWPGDVAAVEDRLYVCTDRYDGRARAIVYSQHRASILTEYTGQDNSEAYGIAVNIELGLTAVLWYQSHTGQNQISFYFLSVNKSFLTVAVESGVSRISISDKGRIVTGNKRLGEVKIYNLENVFSYGRFKKILVSSLGKDDCVKLADFFAIGVNELDDILMSDDRRASTLFLSLEEKGFIRPANVDRLTEAYLTLKMSPTFYYAVNTYQKLRATSYDRLLVTLSAHLTASVEYLCSYFNFSPYEKSNITSKQNLSLSLLLALDEMGIINQSSLLALEQPFTYLRLDKAVAKIQEYQSMIEDGGNRFQDTTRCTEKASPSSYLRFLVTLSAYLTASVAGDLCSYFNIPDYEKNTIASKQNPGLSLLLVLDEMGTITHSSVLALKQPLTNLRLGQAVAKIQEYQSMIKDERDLCRHTTGLTKEEKRNLFMKLLQKKIMSWCEDMTHVLWKGSCQWKSFELFVGTCLILTNSKTQEKLTDVDEQYKLNYTDIFSQVRLTEETRVIIAGEPGSGKTMLSSQLAYDWSQGRISDIDIFILLPLKYVQRKTVVEAIKEFYLMEEKGLSSIDIEDIIIGEGDKCCFLLDGLEEYNGIDETSHEELSEVMKVMTKVKYRNCKVILTSRSDYTENLPPYPVLKLGPFGAVERQIYIEKVFFDDHERQVKVKNVIDGTPFMQDICSVPLFFVLAVHNIECNVNIQDVWQDRVSLFIGTTVQALCPSEQREDMIVKVKRGYDCRGYDCQYQEDPDDYLAMSYSDSELFSNEAIWNRSQEISLERLAFNGLCRGEQHLYWPKHFAENNVRNLSQYLNSGILIIEDTVSIITDVNRTAKYADTERVEEVCNKVDETVSDTWSLSSEGDSDSGKALITRRELYKETFEDLQKEALDTAFNKTWETKSVKQRPGMLENTKHQDITNYEGPTAGEKSKLGKYLKKPLAVQHVSLQVRFLHKVLQEWFAAKYLANIYWKYGDLLLSKKETFFRKHLQNINPADLHYVLSFTCALCPPSCFLILNYLLSAFQSEGGKIPGHIMNCICLCLAEYDGYKGHYIKNAIREACKADITIRPEDSRLLQRVKVSMLQFASNCGLPITRLQLPEVIVRASEDELTFNSGATLKILNTLQKIEISCSDRQLEKKYYAKLIKFVMNSKAVEKALLIFPSQPPILQHETLNERGSKQVSVEWRNEQIVWTLDFSKARWTVVKEETVLSGVAKTQLPGHLGKISVDHEIFKAKVINEEGGTLIIPEAEVCLEICPGALSRDHKIQIKVPSDLNIRPPSSQTLPRLTPLIVCEPDGLEFIKPVKLTVPHCAVIQDPNHHKVTVQVGHKNRSTEEWTWTEEQVEYCLTKKTCSLFLKHFSGLNVNIDSTEEKMLRVIPYAKLSHSKAVLLTLWFCNDLESHFQSVLECGENDKFVPLDSYDTFKLRHVEGAENVLLTLKDASNDWFREEIKECIGVDNLAGENQLYRDFSLPPVFDQDSGTYIYLDLRVNQHLGEKKSETSFTLRKRISDLEKTIPLRSIYAPCENEENIPPFQENPNDRCFAVPYIDPMTDYKDDVILTLWICPFESQRKKLQCLQREQKLLLKHMVKSENSFALTQKETVTAITKFLNGRWHLTPEQEIETKRIQYGSRAKFQFIGKKEDKDEINFINLEVYTFQDESHRTPFIEEVDMRLLLYGRKCIEFPNTEDNSGAHSASTLDGTVVPSNPESCKPSQCSLFGPSSSSEAKDQTKGTNQAEQQVKKTDPMTLTIKRLSKKLGDSWKFVGRNLELDDTVLDNIEKTHTGVREHCYQMLTAWVKHNGSNATHALLVQALLEEDRKDLADDVKRWKDQQNT